MEATPQEQERLNILRCILPLTNTQQKHSNNQTAQLSHAHTYSIILRSSWSFYLCDKSPKIDLMLRYKMYRVHMHRIPTMLFNIL